MAARRDGGVHEAHAEVRTPSVTGKIRLQIRGGRLLLYIERRRQVGLQYLLRIAGGVEVAGIRIDDVRVVVRAAERREIRVDVEGGEHAREVAR